MGRFSQSTATRRNLYPSTGSWGTMPAFAITYSKSRISRWQSTASPSSGTPLRSGIGCRVVDLIFPSAKDRAWGSGSEHFIHSRRNGLGLYDSAARQDSFYGLGLAASIRNDVWKPCLWMVKRTEISGVGWGVSSALEASRSAEVVLFHYRTNSTNLKNNKHRRKASLSHLRRYRCLLSRLSESIQIAGNPHLHSPIAVVRVILIPRDGHQKQIG